MNCAFNCNKYIRNDHHQHQFYSQWLPGSIIVGLRNSPEGTRLLVCCCLKLADDSTPKPVLRLLKGLFSFGLKNRLCVGGGVAAAAVAHPRVVAANLGSSIPLADSPFCSLLLLRLICKDDTQTRHKLSHINQHSLIINQPQPTYLWPNNNKRTKKHVNTF